MCGLFAFAGERGTLDRDLLREAAEGAARRGPHGYGFAWYAGGEYGSFKSTGPLLKWLDRLDEIPAEAEAVIGHARLVTSGALDDIDSYQPLRSADTWVAHNGTVGNHPALWGYLGEEPATTNDSEVLAALMARDPVGAELPLVGRLQLASMMPLPQTSAALLAMEGPLVACGMFGHPLYRVVMEQGPGGASSGGQDYVSSRPFYGRELTRLTRFAFLLDSRVVAKPEEAV